MDYFVIIGLVLVGICFILYIFDKQIPNKEQRRKKREEKLLDKSRSAATKVHMHEDNIDYFLTEIIAIWRGADIRSYNKETDPNSLTIYTDEDLDSLRLYAYSIYKFVIQIQNLNMKHKKKISNEENVT